MRIYGVYVGQCLRCGNVVAFRDDGLSDWDMTCHIVQVNGERCGGVEREFGGDLKEPLQAAFLVGGYDAVARMVDEREDLKFGR